MIEIRLELADNGVIKTIIDDNINGAGNILERKVVYDLTNDRNNLYDKTIELFGSIAQDLAIDLGNAFDKYNLKFSIDWGEKYVPTKEELEERIHMMEEQINIFKKYLEGKKKKISDN